MEEKNRTNHIESSGTEPKTGGNRTSRLEAAQEKLEDAKRRIGAFVQKKGEDWDVLDSVDPEFEGKPEATDWKSFTMEWEKFDTAHRDMNGDAGSEPGRRDTVRDAGSEPGRRAPEEEEPTIVTRIQANRAQRAREAEEAERRRRRALGLPEEPEVDEEVTAPKAEPKSAPKPETKTAPRTEQKPEPKTAPRIEQKPEPKTAQASSRKSAGNIFYEHVDPTRKAAYAAAAERKSRPSGSGSGSGNSGNSGSGGSGGRVSGFVRSHRRGVRNGIIFLVILLLIFIAASVISHRANGNQMTSSGQLIAKSGNSIAQKSPYVGELHIEGEIASGTPQSADSTTYDQNWLIDMIDQMKNDPNNRGLILYVNSPGGSTNATDELYLKVKDYKEETKRPVYTYMADEGASGAYYIAAASDRIYVNRNCWTGSIGVRLSTIYDVTGLMKKLGVKAETVHAGKNKNMGSVTEKLTGQQRKILQGLVDDAYDQFVQIVADGRSMPVSDVRKLADGRVYTAKQAKANGLVDGIVLSYDDAEKQMKKNGGLVGVRTMEILHPTVSYGILDYLTGKAEVTKDGKSRVSGENEKSSEAALLEKLLEENGSYTLSYLSDIRK
ncbi:MAG: signal peptide peptidase SppA [Eubacteriales bacterium]|nr:signal peptide peptidase SppA [Eubacteriales bacterium]